MRLLVLITVPFRERLPPGRSAPKLHAIALPQDSLTHRSACSLLSANHRSDSKIVIESAEIVGDSAKNYEVQAILACAFQKFAENTDIPFDMRNGS
jgi:hypothetical protein